jgi:hypothetical protein
MYSKVPADFRTSSSWWDAFSADAETIFEIGHGMGLSIGEKLGLIE